MDVEDGLGFELVESMQTGELQAILHNEYRKKKALAPAYSLRQFAKRLGMPSGRLSELMTGKRRVTKGLALKIVSGLDLDPETSKAIVDAASANSSLSHEIEKRPSRTIEDETFVAISDWYHFAILSLAETSGFRSDPQWIAERLGVDVTLIRNAIDRLLFIGLLTLEGSTLRPAQAQIKTRTDLKSLALRKSHRQSLDQAIQALDDIPLELRDITSITMAISLKKVPLAKMIIQDFRQSLSTLLETGPGRDEVYNLNVQLVPVTKISNTRARK